MKRLLTLNISDIVDSSVITFIGADFAINGTPVAYGEYDTMGADWIHGTLTGTLADGVGKNQDFYIYDDSKIVLIPEPATLMLIAIGVPFLLKRSRR